MYNSEEQRAAELAAQLAKQEAEQKAAELEEQKKQKPYNGWKKNENGEGYPTYSLYVNENKKEISKKKTLKDLNYDEMKRKRGDRNTGAGFLLFFCVCFIGLFFKFSSKEYKISGIFSLISLGVPTIIPALRLFNLITKKSMQITTGIATPLFIAAAILTLKYN